EAPADVDLVLPIPDSGTPAAIGFSRALGVPFSEGLIKNRYIARTFIQPDQELRKQGVKLKFNPLAEVAGQRVAVVDDSIVRGNTASRVGALPRVPHVRVCDRGAGGACEAPVRSYARVIAVTDRRRAPRARGDSRPDPSPSRSGRTPSPRCAPPPGRRPRVAA